jgi:NAD(P)-dependent dehydrogenase (short-subunit alcohol dehydrogenase family)
VAAPTELAGRVALVTGAARGIGEACAVALAAAGAHVVVTDVDGEAASTVADSIVANGGSASSQMLDVSASSKVRDVVARVVSEHGRLDVAVNNAGISISRVPLADLEDDEWHRMHAVNLHGVFHCMREEIRAMQAAGGSIVNIGSMLSTVGYPDAAAYIAAKHAVLGLTRSAAVDYAAAGIRVNLVAPGHVRTGLGPVGMTSERERSVAAQYPLNRVADPSEVADLVVYISSDRARNVTGACIPTDGGYTAR